VWWSAGACDRFTAHYHRRTRVWYLGSGHLLAAGGQVSTPLTSRLQCNLAHHCRFVSSVNRSRALHACCACVQPNKVAVGGVMPPHPSSNAPPSFSEFMRVTRVTQLRSWPPYRRLPQQPPFWHSHTKWLTALCACVQCICSIMDGGCKIASSAVGRLCHGVSRAAV
jgi:hypothetical protein